LETIKEAMRLRTGRKLSKKAVHQLIYRFRLLLKAHDENQFYVMSDSKLGYRFALRRSSGNVTAASHS
jgi:DNA-binding winged helix-turn-helix (wHTH) protein